MKIIPYGRQSIDKGDIREVVDVLRSDWITQGPKIKEFERMLSKHTGARYAVLVSSGTAALHLACLAVGIGKGDEVITSALTFAASSNCILYCSGKPVFADCEADTGNIDPRNIPALITKKTRALIPVHFSGHPCKLKEIHTIASKKKLPVIEDAAHALGAEYRGAPVGSCTYSDMAIFSFHPVKSITTGEGGAVTTNNRKLYERLLMLRSHGITRDSLEKKNCGDWYYEMQMLGFNYRITDIQAALGVSQLKKLKSFIAKRRSIRGIYDRAFGDNPYFEIQKEKEYAYSACHLYPILLRGSLQENRVNIFNSLRKKGVNVQVHYIPVYLHPYYAKLGYRRGLCPQAEIFYKREISLPLYPSLTLRQIEYVIKAVKSAVNN